MGHAYLVADIHILQTPLTTSLSSQQMDEDSKKAVKYIYRVRYTLYLALYIPTPMFVPSSHLPSDLRPGMWAKQFWAGMCIWDVGNARGDPRCGRPARYEEVKEPGHSPGRTN